MSLKQRATQCSGYIPASKYVPVYSRPHRTNSTRRHQELSPSTPRPSVDDPDGKRTQRIHEAVKAWLESSPKSVLSPSSLSRCRSPSCGSPPSYALPFHAANPTPSYSELNRVYDVRGAVFEKVWQSRLDVGSREECDLMKSQAGTAKNRPENGNRNDAICCGDIQSRTSGVRLENEEHSLQEEGVSAATIPNHVAQQHIRVTSSAAVVVSRVSDWQQRGSTRLTEDKCVVNQVLQDKAEKMKVQGLAKSWGEVKITTFLKRCIRVEGEVASDSAKEHKMETASIALKEVKTADENVTATMQKEKTTHKKEAANAKAKRANKGAKRANKGVLQAHRSRLLAKSSASCLCF